MKKITVLILLTVISTIAYTQNWSEMVLSPNDSKGANFYDIQKEFNDYWKPYNVDAGYYYIDGKKYKAAGWKQFKRWEWYWETRIDRKTGSFPNVNIFKLQQEFAGKNTPKADESNWQSTGPVSSDGGYAGLGRINCVAFHPTDINTFWIGAPSGGLWKTTDGGSTWEVLTDTIPVIGVSEIFIPNNYDTSKEIYIATGDRDGGDNYSIGVLKTTDDGKSWSETGLSFDVDWRYRITRMLVHPTQQNIFYVATNGGIFKSTNAGVSWSLVLDGLFFDLEFKYGCEDTVLYAASLSYSNSPEIFKTKDGGATWTSVHTFPTNAYRVELDVAQSDSTIVYAMACNLEGGLEGIYKSTNSGESFSQVYNGTISGNNLLNWHQSVGDTRTDGQGGYDLTLSVSPTDENHLFLGGINTWESFTGGLTWDLVNHWYGGFSAAEVHADKHYMEYQNASTFFEANDGGIYKTTDGGTTWTDLTDGLVISQIYKLGVSQTSEGDVITGLQDNGSKLLESGVWYDVKGGDGMECIIDYEDDAVQYATYVYGQIDRTTDHWYSSTDITANFPSGEEENGAWVTPYVIDPANNHTLYVGYEDVWKTTDRGDSWTKISNIVLSNKIRSMAIAPSNSNTLYITDFDYLYKTTNGGATWVNMSANLPSTSNSITYISVDAQNPSHLWITYGGYDAIKAFESTDGAASWTDISAGLPEVPANTIIENKLATTRQLYAGTDLGVFFKDGDADWALYSKNLPSVIVTELEIYYNETTPENSILFASTYGRGLWKSNLSTFTLDAIQVNTIEGPFYVSNDSAASINIPFTINETFTSNTFTAYLSDNAGDFSSEIEIGSLVSDVEGTIEAMIPAGTIAGTNYKVRVKSSNPINESAASNAFEVVLDNEAPSVTITSSESSTTTSDLIDVKITFSEDVNGFAESDVVVGNATISTFDDTNASEYNLEISPVSAGEVTVDVAAGVALDIVGNENTVATQWSINYSPTSIDELFDEFGINVYPNPNNGEFSIEFENKAESVEISILDLSGRVLFHELVRNPKIKKIDLKDIANGAYILKIEIDNNILNSKIIIE